MSDNHEQKDPESVNARPANGCNEDYDSNDDQENDSDQDNSPVVTLAPAPDLSSFSEADKLTIRIEALQAVVTFQGQRVNSQFSWRLLRLFERYVALGLNAMDFPQYNKQYRSQNSGRNYANNGQRAYYNNNNGYRRNNGGRY